MPIPLWALHSLIFFGLSSISNPELIDTLDVWDSQLVSLGQKIIERRRRFIEELNEIIYKI